MISSCNVGPKRSRQHYRLFFCANWFVGCGPKCTSNFVEQCWLSQIKTTLYVVIFERIDDHVVWANIALVIFLCNVVSDIFGQHWVYNIHMQCCPSLIDTTLYRLFYSEKLSVNRMGQYCTGKNLVECCPRATLHREKILFNVVLILLGKHCTSKYPRQCCPWGSRQHCTRKNPVQCCLNSLGTTLHR